MVREAENPTYLVNYLAGKLGIIRDGTGDDYHKIVNQKREAEAHGYDTYMIFVTTTLETSLARNRQRPRKLPDDLVISIWNEAQKNLQQFHSLFGNHFTLINNELGSDSIKLAGKAIERFVRTPVQNPIGQRWLYGIANAMSEM